MTDDLLRSTKRVQRITLEKIGIFMIGYIHTDYHAVIDKVRLRRY